MQHMRCAKCRQAIPECPHPLAAMRGAWTVISVTAGDSHRLLFISYITNGFSW